MLSTACGRRMAHRKWKETKQLPIMLPGPAVPGFSLVSFHFLWANLCPQAVHAVYIQEVCFLTEVKTWNMSRRHRKQYDRAQSDKARKRARTREIQEKIPQTDSKYMSIYLPWTMVAPKAQMMAMELSGKSFILQFSCETVAYFQSKCSFIGHRRDLVRWGIMYSNYRILWLPRDNPQGVSSHKAIRAFLGKLAMLRIIWYLI